MLDLRAVHCGTIGDNGATSIGNTVDTYGFADMLVIFQWACVGGTNAAQSRLSLKFQEGDAAASTGGDMTDITMGQINGTFSFAMPYGTAPTYPFLASTCFYERLGMKRDGTAMKRYIRPIASLAGTSGTNYIYTVSVLLGRPRDSALLQKATVFASNQAEYCLPSSEGG